MTCIQFTDIHLGKDNGSAEAFRNFIEEVNAMSPQPDFVIHTGDICLQDGMGQVYQELASQFRAPRYDSLGNHDVLVEETAPKRRWTQLTGRNRFYSFQVRGTHFIVLDGHQVDLNQVGWRNVLGEIGREEMAWLRQDLQTLPAGMPAVAFIHIPIASSYPQRRGQAPGEEPAWEIANAEEVIDLLSTFRVKAVFGGHFHENETLVKEQVSFVSTGALCGAWWDWTRWPHNPDGSPKGYRIIEIDEASGRVSSIYKGLGKDIAEQISLLEPKLIDRNSREVKVIVNVFDGSADWTVECRFDGENWRRMDHFTTGTGGDAGSGEDIKGADPGAFPRVCTHLWQTDLPVPEKGHSGTVEIQATDPLGRAWSQLHEFQRLAPIVAPNANSA